MAMAMVALLAFSANPIVPNVGMADPHGHVFGDKVYVYATHDYSNDNKGFRMDDWWVWSSTNLVDWNKESVVKPSTSIKWDNELTSCWATDAASRNGSYFFYLSAGSDQVGITYCMSSTVCN